MGLNLDKAATGLSSMHSRIVQLERPTEQPAMNRGPTYASAANGERVAQASTSQTAGAANTIRYSTIIMPLPPPPLPPPPSPQSLPTVPNDDSITATNFNAPQDDSLIPSAATLQDDEFVEQRHAIRRQNRLDRRQGGEGRPASRRVVGANRGVDSFTGAPEHSRYLFIYRVSPDARLEDLRTYIEHVGVTIRKLVCMSNDNAVFKSFRLTTTVEHFNKLFQSDIWPVGVRVRKFVSPRR